MIALILDCETTGLVSNHILPLAKQSEVTELYMALVDLTDGMVIDEFDSLFRPSVALSDEVKKITHMTDDMLKDAPKFQSAAKQIKKMIEEAPRLIAHNCSFDTEILQFEYERLNQEIKFPELICTVEQSVHLKGYRLNLMSLHELLFNGERFTEAHRAGPDTKALIRCCVEMYKQGLI